MAGGSGRIGGVGGRTDMHHGDCSNLSTHCASSLLSTQPALVTLHAGQRLVDFFSLQISPEPFQGYGNDKCDRCVWKIRKGLVHVTL